jgi:hypothetical protein
MGNKRDRRSSSDRKRHARGGRGDPALESRRRTKALLAKLGLLGAFEGLPSLLREQTYPNPLPDPVLAFDPSFPTAEAFGGAYAALHEEIREGFDGAAVKLDGFDLTVRDFHAIVVPVATVLRNSLRKLSLPMYMGPRPPAGARAFLEKASPVFDELSREEVLSATATALHDRLVLPLVRRSRLDGRLLYASVSRQILTRRSRLVITLRGEQPAMKYLRLDAGPGRTPGGSRPMHRVGTSNTWNNIEWASWSRAVVKGEMADQIGLPAGAEWPVFVQSHALKQLRNRLDTCAYADWAEHWMHESLKSPKIVSRERGGDVMVALEPMGERLGYLVCTPRDGMVAVRTFLFLTMRNTFEGRELSRRLKLTRDEMEYLRLHELSRFTRTDLKDDPALRKIFKECGCGHLFELAEDEHAFRPAAGASFAKELREYVGLAA